MPTAPARSAAPSPVTQRITVAPGAWEVLATLRRDGPSALRDTRAVLIATQALTLLGLLHPETPKGTETPAPLATPPESLDHALEHLRFRLTTGPALVPPAQRLQWLEANLAADHRAVLSSAIVERARRIIDDELLFETPSGERLPARPGPTLLWSWRWAGPFRRGAAQAADALAARPGEMAPPIALVGLSPPWGALAFIETTHQREHQRDLYTRRIMLIEPDDLAVARAIASADLSPLLVADRIDWCLGRVALRSLEDAIRSRPFSAAPSSAAAASGVSPAPGVMPAISEILQRTSEERLAAAHALRDAAHHHYHDTTPAQWAHRFTSAAAGERRARVLVSTSLHSTFLRHAGHDLVEAFGAIGHDAELLMEPDAHTLNTGSAILDAINRFKPDLVVVPNHLRPAASLGFPPHLPFLTWVQDAMPHLFDAATMSAVSPYDLFAGYTFQRLFDDLAVAPEAALPAPIPVSARKFHPGPVSPRQRDRFAADVVIISNHGVPPEALREQLLAPFSHHPALHAAAQAVADHAEFVVERAAEESLADLTPALVRAVLNEHFRRDPAPDELSQLEFGVLYPLASRLLRHRVTRDAAAHAADRGLTIRLFGANWDEGEFAHLAAGPVEHGDDLRACYQSAAVVIHADLRAPVHQRVLECALSGGFPAIFRPADSLSRATHAAATELIDGAAHPIRRLPDGRAAFHPAGSPRAEHLAAVSAALGRPLTEIIQPVGCPAPHRFPDRALDLYDLTRLLPDLPAMTFTDAQSLGHLVDRALAEPVQRADLIDRLRARVEEAYTYEAFASRLLEHAAKRLRSLADPR